MPYDRTRTDQVGGIRQLPGRRAGITETLLPHRLGHNAV
jgi:hypothetical protein